MTDKKTILRAINIVGYFEGLREKYYYELAYNVSDNDGLSIDKKSLANIEDFNFKERIKEIHFETMNLVTQKDFEIIENTTYVLYESEKKEFLESYELRKIQGHKNQKAFLTMKEKQMFRMINDNEAFMIYANMPINNTNKVSYQLGLLANILFWQFLDNYISQSKKISAKPITNDATPSVCKTKEKQSVKLSWASDKQVLYWLFSALRQEGLIKSNYTDIAQMIHQNFENMPPSVNTIVKQLKETNSIPRKVKDIDEIILILKRLKINGLK